VEVATGHLLGTIEVMMKHGERRRQVLSNKAIASYQRFRAQQRLCLAS
jgi:hypothetical protein